MSRFNDLSAILERSLESGPRGCACVVAKDGKTLYEGYYGHADVEADRRVDAGTIYRLFSMTKVIVCTAAMILFERGRFLLNDPLCDYLPELADMRVAHPLPNGSMRIEPARQPILVRHAFAMTAGTPYPFGNSYASREAGRVREELRAKQGRYDLRTEIKAVAEAPLAFEPGTRWLYGYGHDLVAGLIEATSGMSVGEFLRTEIFEPLGMSDTGYRLRGDMADRLAVMYEKQDGEFVPASKSMDENHQPDAIYEGGGSGLLSTARDYLRFTQALACGGTIDGVRIVGRKTIDLMRTNQLNPEQISDFTNSYTAGYGYGLGVRTMVDPAAGGSNTSIGEFGWTGFAGTWTSIDPSEGYSVVYMHQMIPNEEEYHHLRVRAAAYAAL